LTGRDGDGFLPKAGYKARASERRGSSSAGPIRNRTLKPPESKITQNLRRLMREIHEPASLFSGMTIQQSLAPENIIIFKRTDTTLLKPEGVSVNFHHRFELVTVLDTAAP